MLNKAGRPVGARIREALAVLERIGPARACEVCAHLDGVGLSNAGKYCSRAVGLRLATVDRTGTRPVYAVVPGWLELIDQPRPCAEPEKQPQPFALQAVWSAHP